MTVGGHVVPREATEGRQLRRIGAPGIVEHPVPVARNGTNGSSDGRPRRESGALEGKFSTDGHRMAAWWCGTVEHQTGPRGRVGSVVEEVPQRLDGVADRMDQKLTRSIGG